MAISSLRQSACRAYRRAAREDTLLAPHAAYLRERAVEVDYSAQALFQELRSQHYRGSYETVTLRAAVARHAVTSDGDPNAVRDSAGTAEPD